MKNLLLVISAVVLSFNAFAALTPISGPSNVCSASALILTNATPGGTWTVSSTTIATITGSSGSTSSSAVLVGGSVSTSSVVTVTYTVGAEAVNKLVTVNPLPAPIIGPPAICNGTGVHSVTLTCATSGGVWSCVSTGFDTISSTGILYDVYGTGGIDDTDIIKYTLPTGCYSKDTVYVRPIRVASFPPTLCLGGGLSTASCAPTGGTWSSSAPGIATINPTTGVIIPLSIGATTFTYTYLGCTISGGSVVSNGISDHIVNNDADTTCSDVDFYIAACGTSATYNATTAFGDGTYNSTLFGGAVTAHIYHNYDFPGTYRVKQKLFRGSTLVDSIAFDYEYMHCKTIPIKMYVDNNHNCTLDGDEHFSYIPVTIQIDSNGQHIDTISTTGGLYYRALGPTGTVYAFRVLSTLAGVTQACPSSGVIYETIRDTVNTYTTKYFGMNSTVSFDYDLTQSSSMRCGRHMANTLVQISNSFGTVVNPTVKVNFSPKYTFRSAEPTPASISGNTITWNFDTVSSMRPAPDLISITLYSLGTWLLPGDTVHTSISVNPTSEDVDTTNNNTVRVDTVKSSYDPNEISVIPSGIITSGTTLQYTVMFENDGNDTAHNIHIMDTLSEFLDISTLKTEMATATMNIAIRKVDGQNIVKFDFPNIMLPDSSHHNLCQGMVIFNIRTREDVPPGTFIPNRVGIYFDDNEVVMTNTATDLIGTPTIINNLNAKALEAELFPNPATDLLTIKTEASTNGSISISNSIGQVLLQQSLDDNKTNIDIKTLPSGLYYAIIKGENGSIVKKFVKQ